MDDLSAMLSQILGSEEGMAQLRNAAAQLGLTQNNQPPPQPSAHQQGGGGSQGGNTPDLSALAAMLSGAVGGQGQNAPAAPQGGGAQQGGNTPDLSALASMLSGAMGSQSQSAPSAPQGGGTPDLSALASMLSGAMGGQGQNTPSAAGGGGGADLSSLAAMLSGAMGGGGGASPLQGIDMNTILTLQKAYQTFTARDRNTDLLLALKPHFNPERQKKVDDAIRILGLIKLLPLLKESGLLESLGGLLGGEDT